MTMNDAGRAMRNVRCGGAMRALGIAALLTLAPALAAQNAPAPATAGSAGTYVVRGATIVPVSGPRIPNGTVVISGGRIAAVGANVQAPAGATVIDGSGLFVYPGLIDSGTQLGLTEIGSVPGPTDLQELGEFNPQNVALTAVNAHSELIPVARANGITTAITGPRGGLISGQVALIDLAGWTPAEMAAQPRAAMVVNYPRSRAGGRRFGPQQSESEQQEAMNRQVRALYDFFRDAKTYAEVVGRTEGRNGGRANLVMQAMLPVVRGEQPVLFDVDAEDQIRGVLALADTFGLKAIVRGGSDAWKLADELARRQIPVIVGPLTRAPAPDEPYDAIFANPGALARAGVKIAFQTDNASDSRNLPYNAALATAYGLDPDVALRALTITPAEIWGVADRYGSIDPGKVANVIVTTGDPLDVRTTVTHLFIRGELVPFTDRHTELYDRFRARPKP
ncbi:MAG TPA: amidohydrolase family protein [Gemmatimonadaceae bacterium]|nr:amidohydrolase family protein [Gemmatimonadaceae bacterium]